VEVSETQRSPESPRTPFAEERHIVGGNDSLGEAREPGVSTDAEFAAEKAKILSES
jgi:hypothetical protein